MNGNSFVKDNYPVEIRRYRGEGRAEIHAVLRPCPESDTFCRQYKDIKESLDALLHSEREEGRNMKVAFGRCHLSDSVNQSQLVDYPSVGQPPASGTKVEMLVVLVESDGSREEESYTVVERGSYSDINFFREAISGEPLYKASENSLREFDALLKSEGVSLSDNCVRTWFWVRDIDTEYSKMVKARNDVFKTIGLTSSTHFIASTGIGGEMSTPFTPLLFSAIAIKGLCPGQIRYIKAPNHLNDTIDYGVAFERATAVDYGDRRVLYVSGTASIDSKGEIFAPGDVIGQTERMCDNIDALLSAAGCGKEDLMHSVLYVRDPADLPFVRRIVAERYPETPCLAVKASVCRPGWLVEMECMAMRPQKDNGFEAY